MNTLIDITILLSAYAGLSLVCGALLRVLWASVPHRPHHEQVTTRGW
jgi:hypothetical protein